MIRGDETDLGEPTERFNALTLTDSLQTGHDGVAWSGIDSASGRRPGTEEANIHTFAESTSPSSPALPVHNIHNPPSHLQHNRDDVEQNNAFPLDPDIDEPPSYEASVASSSVSGRTHVQDGSYNSMSSETSGWGEGIVDMKVSGHQREKAMVDTSETSSSSRSASFGEEQGELLPYLQDTFEDARELRDRSDIHEHQARNMTTLNTIPQLPPDTMRRPTRPPPDIQDLMDAVSPPPTTRYMSEPSPPVSERPQLPPRGKTSPRFPGTMDLDKIDELDETTPHGYALHHRGPYEFRSTTATPPARVPEIRRDEQVSLLRLTIDFSNSIASFHLASKFL